MKKIFLFFLITLSACVNPQIKNSKNSNFFGVWYLNKSDKNFDGKIIIKNCNESKCEFNMHSSQYGHTCDVDGIMKISSDDKADYYFKYLDASIKFSIMSDKNMNVQYGNTHSYNAFCGMNATIEGIWMKD